MSLPDFIKKQVEKKLKGFCESRVPPHVRNQLTLSFNIRGNNITIVENRAPWREGLSEWTHMSIAQLRYDVDNATWKLYCRDRNEKWWLYKPFAPSNDIDKVLQEIDRDPTGIFWG